MPFGIHTRGVHPACPLTAVVAAATIGLTACGGSNPTHVASLRTIARLASTSGRGSGTGGGSLTTDRSSGSSAAKLAKGNPTALVDEWATCMHSHGNPYQGDPTIDAHGVINITVPLLGSAGPVAGDPHAGTGTCSEYLAAAERALRAADTVQDPLGVYNQADILKDVACMRASGVPNYPYPQGNTTDFNGTGVDPTSPSVVKVSIRCGNELHLPLWWSACWGPPGDVSVRTSSAPGAPPHGALVSAYGASTGGAPHQPPVSGANGGSGAGG